MNTLTEFGFDTHKMRIHGYDGAANTSGVHRTINRYQRQCTATVRLTAVYLAIGHVCEQPLIRNMLSTVQTIAFAFDFLANRLLTFQESVYQNAQVRHG